MLHTTTYGILRQAVVDMRQVLCQYNGYYRELCPHAIGQGKDGKDMVFTYQFAGETSKGKLPAQGEWRCMRVADLEILEIRSGPWHTAESHLRPQSCVKIIDAEVPHR